MNSSLYEQDFLLWTEQQPALLRAGKLADLDIENLGTAALSVDESGIGTRSTDGNTVCIMSGSMRKAYLR